MNSVVHAKQEDLFLYCGPDMKHCNFWHFNFWQYGS